jgi:micrococcal nuclease
MNRAMPYRLTARRATRWAPLVVLVFLAAPQARADFCGRVTSVHDGDTLTVLAGNVPRRVPYGSASRRALAARVAGRDVTVVERGRDAYGRTLGRVVVGGSDANAAQVRDGYAWVFRRFENDAVLIALEAEARSARRGLWRSPEPVPPWVWRERHPPKPPPRGSASSATTPP